MSVDSSFAPTQVADQRDDAPLLLATRDGDMAAYGLLFDRHRDAAMRLARSLTSPSNADDLVSEAFVKTAAGLPSFSAHIY